MDSWNILLVTATPTNNISTIFAVGKLLDAYSLECSRYGNVPTQYAASKQSNSEVCLGVLPTATDYASTKLLTKDV